MPPKKVAVQEPASDFTESSGTEEEVELVEEKVSRRKAPAKAPVKKTAAPQKRRTKAQIAADEAARELGPSAELSVNVSAGQIAEANAKPAAQTNDPEEELSLADLQKLIKIQSGQSDVEVAAVPQKKPRGRPRKNPPTQPGSVDQGSSREIIESVKLLSRLVLESGQQYKTINERLDSLTKSEDQAMKKQMADDIAKTRMFFQNLHKK